MIDKSTHDIISKTNHIEGGTVNNPNDPGGLTRYGISQRAFPSVDIRNLTFEQAIQIGYDHYWTPNNLKSYTNNGYAWKCFEIAFNMGSQSLTLLGLGVMPGNEDADAGVEDLIQGMLARYDLLVEHRKQNEVFLKGWDNRARMKYITGEAYNS